MIRLQLNGEPREIAAPMPVAEFLRELGLVAGVLVEHNGRALFPAEWNEVILTEGDRLEILRVAAGG